MNIFLSIRLQSATGTKLVYSCGANIYIADNSATSDLCAFDNEIMNM